MEIDELRFKLRYKLLQDQLLELNIPGFQNDLSYQHFFLDKLDVAYKRFKTCVDSNQTVCFKNQSNELDDNVLERFTQKVSLRHG